MKFAVSDDIEKTLQAPTLFVSSKNVFIAIFVASYVCMQLEMVFQNCVDSLGP